MIATANLYRSIVMQTAKGEMHFNAATIKLALVTSAYTPDDAHSDWTQVSPFELPSGNGYTTGGVTVTEQWQGHSQGAQGNTSGIELPAMTASFRYGVLYIASGGSTAFYQPLIAWYLFDSTPANIALVGEGLKLTFPSTQYATLYQDLE